MMQPMRLGFRLLQRVSPEMSAALAERLFFTAPRTRLGDDLRAVLARGERFTLRLDGRPVVGWSWGPAGAGTPVIYLMHGWGSRGGRLAGFVEPLLEAGYRVVTHDAPGHGSSYGRLSSLPQFAAAMLAVAERFGPAAGVIAHSMGGSATTLAMARGFTVSRAVFIAPAANPPAWVEPFAGLLGLSRETVDRLRERSERRIGVRWDDLDIPTLARQFAPAPPLLVVHDRDDRVVSWNDGAAIVAAWAGAELVSTTGLGHRDIVRAPDVVARTIAFIRAVNLPD